MTPAAPQGFRQEALFYEGLEWFMASVLPFVRGGVGRGEPVMVAVDAAKTARLREALGDGAGAVRFVDMPTLGRNPGCIIPAWREFVADAAREGRPARGVGEPIWRGRSEAELEECHRHEALLNVAFDGGPEWRLVCPYDTAALPAEVLERARRTHPYVGTDAVTGRSAHYRRPGRATLAGALPRPPARCDELEFTKDDLATVRALVQARSRSAGLDAGAAADAVLAVNELATNAIRHGGGRGVLRAWADGGALVCEVRDAGRIDDPLAGRGLPGDDVAGGRGLWLVNQVCDLVQLRSLRAGSTVRVHVRARP